MQEHELYMRRCLELAELASGQVSPNPMVGALLVHDGRIVAENFHRKAGKAHAEVLVIEDVLSKFGEEARAILENSTLYVSLEPCSHTGKTPPCADLIIKHRISRVVIAMQDPFAKVSGKGIAKLQEAGVAVTLGVLEDQSRWLNRRFITYHTQHRPYIILKWAQTADGFMAPVHQEKKWITGAASKQLVHRWRAEEDAILVGSGTALADNPQLNVRQWSGKDPVRVLIDKNLSVPEDAAIFKNTAQSGQQDQGEVIVFNAIKSEWTSHKKLIELENFDLYLPQQLSYQLYLLDIQSVLIEGGVRVLQTFLEAGLWDEIRVLQADTEWGEGRKAPSHSGTLIQEQQVGADRLYTYKKIGSF